MIDSIFGRDKPRYAAGITTRNNCYLMYDIAIRQYMADNSMASFMVGSQLLFFLVHNLALALRPNGDLLKSGRHVTIGDLVVIMTCGDDCRFVCNICQISTRATCRLSCQRVKVNIMTNRFLGKMNFQNSFAVLTVRQTDIDTAIKAARAQ